MNDDGTFLVLFDDGDTELAAKPEDVLLKGWTFDPTDGDYFNSATGKSLNAQSYVQMLKGDSLAEPANKL